jgi:hypothetical protein
VELGQPRALAVGADDTLYLSDAKGWIATVTPDGEVKRLAELPEPGAIAVDAARNCFVVTKNKVVKVTPAGKVTDFVGAEIAGAADGSGAASSFNRPLGLAIAADGTLFVHDTGNAKLRMVTPAGVVSTLPIAAAGTHGANAFDAGPIAIGPAGTLYLGGPGLAFAKVDLADRSHPVLTAIDVEPFTPGPRDVAPRVVEGLAVDAKGRPVFLDGRYLRQIDTSVAAHPKLLTLAGFGAFGGNTWLDGPGSTAGTGDLLAIAASPTHAGVYYFLEGSADLGQQRVRRLGLAP